MFYLKKNQKNKDELVAAHGIVCVCEYKSDVK